MKKSKQTKLKAITLFSGIGVDEFDLCDAGIDVKMACELSPKRVEIYKQLHPTPNVICGDLCNSEVKKKIIHYGQKEKIDLLIATPPCQGVSWAGMNKSVSAILCDSRNSLVLNAIEIFDAISPNYFIIENVPRFQDMLFPSSDRKKLVPLKELLQEMFSSRYEIAVAVLNAADFGVPQTRYRIVYRLWKKGLSWGDPVKERQISLREAIEHLPSLESGEASTIPNHIARKIPQNHIECMRHTPTGMSAFDNPVFFPKKSNGERIKGFKNTFKRMSWDKPAPTVTMRNEIASSQENVHPGRPLPDGTWSDARVFTLRELFIVSSLPPDLVVPPGVTETAFRQLIGEGIPPMMLAKIIKRIGH